MTALIRRPGAFALLVPAAMLLAGLEVLVAWPWRQWSLVAVAMLIGLAPGVHAALLREGAQRRTVVWVSLIAGAVAILPFLNQFVPFTGSGGCEVTFIPTTVIPIAVAIALLGSAAYALATSAAAWLAGPEPTIRARAVGLIVGLGVMAAGAGGWIPLSGLLLAQSVISCPL